MLFSNRSMLLHFKSPPLIERNIKREIYSTHNTSSDVYFNKIEDSFLLTLRLVKLLIYLY